MSNKKQSSVEWLYNTIDYEIVSYLDGEIDLNELSIAMLKIKEQAKAMHKEEIMNAVNKGCGSEMCYLVNSKQREQYYNETFGGQDE
jgi:hypothetical protein